MTARELIAVLVRRWYVVVLGIVLTGVCGYLLVGREAVYYTRVEVVVLPPQERDDVNVLTAGPYSLTELAGLLVTRYNDGHQPLTMNDAEATIFGQGTTAGEVVRLHNSGNQWVSVFDKPVIEVEVVDPDPRRVVAETDRTATALQRILDDYQHSFGIATTSQVTLRSSPDDPLVRELRGNRSRTAAATLAVGGWATLVAAYVIDRTARRRHRRPASLAGE